MNSNKIISVQLKKKNPLEYRFIFAYFFYYDKFYLVGRFYEQINQLILCNGWIT